MTKHYVTNNYEIINIDKIQAVSIRYYIKELEDTAKEPLKHFKIDYFVSFKLDNNQTIEERFCHNSDIETLRTKDDKISAFNDEYKKYTEEQLEKYNKALEIAEMKKKELACEIKKVFLNPSINYHKFVDYENSIRPSIDKDTLKNEFNKFKEDEEEYQEDICQELTDDEFLEEYQKKRRKNE